MKPRTKLQFQVLELSTYLPDVKEKMLSFAKEKVLIRKGYATKSRVVCMECGEKFPVELVSRKRAACPHCFSKLKVKQTRCTTDKQHCFVTISDICGEFQVIRSFEIYSYHKAGEEAYTYTSEILQQWILPNGKIEIVGRNHTVNWYVDSWNGDMEIRKDTYRKKYDIYPDAIHPESRFTPLIKRYGIDHKLRGITLRQAINHVPDSPRAETLIKAKQYSLLRFSVYSSDGPIYQHWPSIKICMRNKYVVKDAQMWLDYLDLLAHFRKDLRNAHYVCPADLKQEHDRLVAKKRLAQEREHNEKKRKKAIEAERIFKELKAKFFGICFSDKELKIQVIESVEDFITEGDTLRHCVFTNEYYLKPNSLVLSARIGDKRIETIEINLETLQVVQSRGLCNKNTEYHDRILSLVNKNINLIRRKLTA